MFKSRYPAHKTLVSTLWAEVREMDSWGVLRNERERQTVHASVLHYKNVWILSSE